MVTAAHCTIDGGVKNLHTWVKFAPSVSFADREGQDLFTNLNAPAHGWIKADNVIPHPQYVGSYPNTYDVGLVILEKPVKGASYGHLPGSNSQIDRRRGAATNSPRTAEGANISPMAETVRGGERVRESPAGRIRQPGS